MFLPLVALAVVGSGVLAPPAQALTRDPACARLSSARAVAGKAADAALARELAIYAKESGRAVTFQTLSPNAQRLVNQQVWNAYIPIFTVAAQRTWPFVTGNADLKETLREIAYGRNAYANWTAVMEICFW